MERQLKVGSAVVLVDRTSKPHDALVTAIWGDAKSGSINVVFVSDDENANDQYGRQIVREYTSVPHKANQAAPGYFWCWPEEL